MTTKARRRYAHEQARDLAKLVRALNEPSSAPRMIQNAVNAQVVINRIVWALQTGDDRPSGTISPEVEPDLEAPMQALAAVIRDQVDPHGFALLVFEAGHEPGRRMNYVSNTVRDDIVVAMREFIAAHEERIQPSTDTKQ